MKSVEKGEEKGKGDQGERAKRLRTQRRARCYWRPIKGEIKEE